MFGQIDGVLALPVIGAFIKLALLIVLLLLFRRALDVVVRRIEQRLDGRVGDIDRRRRLDTLLRAGHGAVTIVVLAIGLTMALELFGFNIGPLLASAGVAGLAISLGATTMIQDYS